MVERPIFTAKLHPCQPLDCRLDVFDRGHGGRIQSLLRLRNDQFRRMGVESIGHAFRQKRSKFFEGLLLCGEFGYYVLSIGLGVIELFSALIGVERHRFCHFFERGRCADGEFAAAGLAPLRLHVATLAVDERLQRREKSAGPAIAGFSFGAGNADNALLDVAAAELALRRHLLQLRYDIRLDDVDFASSVGQRGLLEVGHCDGEDHARVRPAKCGIGDKVFRVAVQRSIHRGDAENSGIDLGKIRLRDCAFRRQAPFSGRIHHHDSVRQIFALRHLEDQRLGSAFLLDKRIELHPVDFNRLPAWSKPIVFRTAFEVL